MPHIALEAILSIQRLRLVQGFLIFALGGGREGGEAGKLAAGDKTKHDFDGDEHGDDNADSD